MPGRLGREQIGNDHVLHVQVTRKENASAQLIGRLSAETHQSSSSDPRCAHSRVTNCSVIISNVEMDRGEEALPAFVDQLNVDQFNFSQLPAR